MTVKETAAILDKWNFWNQKLDTGFKRECYLSILDRYLTIPEVVALTGVRRSGKSTIILQLIERLIQGGVDPINTLYINFEEPRLGEQLNVKSLNKIFDDYVEFFEPKGKVYLFLDEVQLVPKWERFVSSLYDRKDKIKIFITGSSSKLLMGEISTLLSGRYVSEIVYPLSFKEFLDYKKISYNPLLRSPLLYRNLRDFIEYGGFPRVVMEKDKFMKKMLLVEYYNSILEKDVLLRHSIRNKKDIMELTSFTLANISNPISSYQIEKTFDISSQNTRRYFEYFSEAFLLQFATFFSYSVKKQIYNPEKVYAIDIGLASTNSFRFSDDVGRLLENLVAIELLRRKHKLYYWSGKKEIDFILRDGHQVSKIINVCYALNSKSLEREIGALELGLNENKKATAILLYWEGEPIKHKRIEFKNILDFLLEDEVELRK